MISLNLDKVANTLKHGSRNDPIIKGWAWDRNIFFIAKECGGNVNGSRRAESFTALSWYLHKYWSLVFVIVSSETTAMTG